EASNDFALVVSNSIKSWSDLAGQPIGVFSPGASSDILCHKLLEANGLSGTQINCVGQGDDPTRTQAMLAGKSVGTVIEPFDIITALVTGKYHILASVPQILPNLLFSVLYTSRAYASAHPDIIAKITEAALLADQWAHNETAWISKEQVEFPGTNTTVAGAAWKVWMAMNIWDPYGGLSASKLNYSMNYFVNISSISSTLAPNYWSDLSYQGTAIQTVGNFTGPLLGYPDNSIPKLNVSIPGVPSVIISNPGRLFGEGSSTGIFFAVPVESSWNSGRGF
ncbi:MAG: ABC transporter substrate-binding protein, partial [Nitrososphaerales archaeon]